MTTDNKNNASQTLFRFVSLRNPQLTETKDKNLGFIHRKDKLTGIFDNAVKPQLTNTALVKFGLMEREAKTFALLAFKKESEIENDTALNEILKLGRKMAKKEPLSADDETAAVAAFQKADGDMLTKLWNNLIFQVLTQQNFYVKEAVTQMLKALHFGYVCTLQPSDELKKINGPDLKAKAREAKIVLPASLFCDGNTGNTSANGSFQVDSSPVGKGMIGASELPVTTQQQLKTEGKEITERLFLSYETNELSALKSELEKIRDSFYKLRTKAQQASYAEYLSVNKRSIDLYNAKLAEINDKIDNKASQEEIDKLYIELESINLPVFSFTYKNELNFEDLKTKLPENLFRLFIRYFTRVNLGNPMETALDLSQVEIVSDKEMMAGKIPVAITDEYDTFNEVFERLEQEISSKAKTLFSKAPLQQQEYAKIGNVLVPVAGKTTYTEISGTYYLTINNLDRSTSDSGSYLYFYYNTDSASLGLSSASISVANSPYDGTISSIDVADGKVIFPVTHINEEYISGIKIMLFFKNGESTLVQYENMTPNKEYTGKFSFRAETDDTEEGSGNNAPGTFTPKHFGVKRLGIADYLKVVQSTQAYIPGEVTHIENIMAKEFKQKSTRKLRRSEIQNTVSKSTERETLSDTTSTTRNDMQSEVANILQQQINAEAYFRYGKENVFQTGGSFAAHNSKEISTRQAIEKSTEITEKAAEKILTKVAEERIEKIIEEFEENNAHEFDNRNGDKHVIGVYRWVDKKMKNQIYNYGKRTMFEFMIPEPAKLHRLATFASKETVKEPVDPRKASREWIMPNSKAATRELLQHWADIYGVKLTEIKEKAQHVENFHDEFHDDGECEISQKPLTVPANYVCKSVDVSFAAIKEKTKRGIKVTGDFNNGIGFVKHSTSEAFTLTGFNLSGNWVFKNSGYNIGTVDISLKLNLEIHPSFIDAWKQENFDAIITAYEAAYAEFLVRQKEAEEKAKAEQADNEEKIGNFYREMESVILKHNCIAYLLQDYLGILGKKFTNGTEMKDFSITLSNDLDQYTALAKFMEQAFEWSIMDYTFYPYYWASRDEWQKMYLSESADPLFRNFLQAGMARVIVTVNPGFEDAVQFFMSTGRIWNGGEVPVIGDPMYMSIVDEMREPLGVKQGKAWITIVPTSLNILQKDAAGLKTATALPFFPENPEEFEVPSDVVTVNEFSVEPALLNSGDDKFIDHIGLNEGFLQLTNDDNPKEVIAQLSLAELKKALQ